MLKVVFPNVLTTHKKRVYEKDIKQSSVCVGQIIQRGARVESM